MEKILRTPMIADTRVHNRRHLEKLLQQSENNNRVGCDAVYKPRVLREPVGL